MGVRRVEDLVAFQLVGELKREMYRLVRSSNKSVDLKYQGQLFSAIEDAEADVAEGLQRDVPGEFSQFLRYALASLAEARKRMANGVARGYFTEAECQNAKALGRRADDVISALQRSLEPFLKKRRPRPIPQRPGRFSSTSKPIGDDSDL